MNRYFTLALVVLASIATGSCAIPYGSNAAYAPAVQQLSLSQYPNIDQYLNSAPAYNGQAPSYSAPSYAPASSVVLPSAPSYASASAQNSAAAPSYSAPASSPVYNAPAPSNGYGPSPSYAVQPAYTSQIYSGQQNYKAYAAPKVSSRVSLPIIPTEPVARLYVPRQNAYGSTASY